jgi:cytochrome c5
VRYRGEMFKEWDGDLLAGALKGQHVSKLDLDGDIIRSEYPILRELGGRVRDIEVAVDGSIYFLVQTGSLYHLSREPVRAAASVPVEPAVIYGLVCAGCHDNGSYDAPNPKIGAQWTDVLNQPRAQIYTHTLDGKGAMPARGMCHLCTDEHLQQTVDWMLDQAAAATSTAH